MKIPTALFILDLEGVSLTPEEKELFAHPAVGGVIFFSRNYESPSQLRSLVQEIHQVKRSSRLLLTVDQEGGRVQRFRKGFTDIPAMSTLGELYERDPQKALEAAENWANILAAELKAFEIDFSFAPVLDLNKGVSEVIGNRAFHREPSVVIALARAWIKGMRAAGLKTVGKHFPGHGSVAADSHVAIPVDSRLFNEIEKEDIQPFSALIHELDAIMPAHVIYEKCDSKPAGFSSFWLQTILRGQLEFKGKIFSDDLSMEGAAAVGDISSRTQAAISAGCDYLLICNDRQSALKVIEKGY